MADMMTMAHIMSTDPNPNPNHDIDDIDDIDDNHDADDICIRLLRSQLPGPPG